MKLAIISHTEHYRDAEGNIVGWGPTITEINHLIESFDQIYHLAFFHDVQPPPSSLPYTSKTIIFVPLPVSGGRTKRKKIGIIGNLPETLEIVHRTLKEVDVFQFRAPVGIGVYLIPWLTFFHNKKGWFKYAGNWNQTNAPVGFALQRWMLKKQSRKVTINGKWPDQPEHCITFENPCLTLEEREEGAVVVKQKKYEPPFSFVFVGRLEDEKGVQLIIDAFGVFIKTGAVDKITFVGDGPKKENYRKKAQRLNLPAEFCGFLNRTEVFRIYNSSHFLLLPSSASEGFPKVIAEAMNYGCIPVVSDISSIGQYIKDGKNGILIRFTTKEGLLSSLFRCLKRSDIELKKMINYNYSLASLFTFQRYISRIICDILEE